MSKQNQPQCILHGEAMIFESALPKGAKQIKPSNNSYHIIADSETTGNHHVVAAKPGVEFWQDGDTTYMTCEKETEVSCVLKDRHSPITIPPGSYEFGIQQEFDHFAQHLRNVAD